MLYNWVTKGVEPPKFTAVTDVVLITRDNFKEELAKKGCNSLVELAPPRRGLSAEERSRYATVYPYLSFRGITMTFLA